MKLFPPALVILLLIAPSTRAELPSFRGGAALAETPSPDPLVEVVPALAPSDGTDARTAADWGRFLVLIWQYRTDVRRDLELYREAGFAGFHIDRGAGQEDVVAFARERDLPYYVDHAADKGYLHLTERTGVEAVMRKKDLIARPHSLADPATRALLHEHLERNLVATREGPVVAYSFDDEISLGSFNSPAEVDASPPSLRAFRDWLRASYGEVGALNEAWGTDYRDFSEPEPVSFEALRRHHAAGPFADWRLARWMDWRSAMDTQFSSVLAELTRRANELDPTTPAGFVGGQQPSAYGGFDYAKLCRSVQWMEAYDIGATNEILRSFWGGEERRPVVQTWFSTGDPRRDSWFLWYYLAHGNRGVIAWPDSGGGPWFREGAGLRPNIAALAETVREVQGPLSETLLAEDVRFDADPVAVFHSMPSIRASWVTDVIPHGGTWPNRSSSLDNGSQSAGKNREAWFKLLEDCGYQYEVVDGSQVAVGHLVERGCRVLILNRAMALSDEEIAGLEAFVAAGGTIVADHWAGVLDERGTGRALPNRIDRLFGIERAPLEGYFGAGRLNELDGEKYREPYLDRLAYAGAGRIDGIVRVGEVEGESPVVREHAGGGRTVWLDRSPLEYWDNGWRVGEGGHAWRSLVSGLLREAGLTPRVRVLDRNGEPIPLVETLFWHRGDRRILCVVMNPTRQGSITGLGDIEGVPSKPLEVTLAFRERRRGLRDLRSGEAFADGDRISLIWRPWEALVIEMRGD